MGPFFSSPEQLSLYKGSLKQFDVSPTSSPQLSKDIVDEPTKATRYLRDCVDSDSSGLLKSTETAFPEVQHHSNRAAPLPTWSDSNLELLN